MVVEDKTAELRDKGFCILERNFSEAAIRSCREAFWPALMGYLDENQKAPNRGEQRHFLAMPFDPPCFRPEFFFDAAVLAIVRAMMDDRVVADQWGCDVPLQGSAYQEIHADYKRPLFAEVPGLPLPVYMLAVSFGLTHIGMEQGPTEIAPGTHKMPRNEALRAVQSGDIKLHRATLNLGDVLIRHPWALHRGTPNLTGTPRALVTIRYVRRWYADDSRDVNAIPLRVWQSLSSDQQSMMRFPVEPV
jgi:ectoine hydroxylase-related dioxygenase (phytanoyl-CoA dioxygenase family)